jgi:hypothetical protein
MNPMDTERMGGLLAEEQRLCADAISPPADMRLSAFAWQLLLQVPVVVCLYWLRHAEAQSLLWLFLAGMLLVFPSSLYLRVWRWQRYASRQAQLAACRRQLDALRAQAGSTP